MCAFLLSGVLFVSAACEEDKRAGRSASAEKVKYAPTQDTPQGAILKSTAAFRAKKLPDYLKTVQYTPAQKRYVVAMFGMNVTCDLQKALVEKFGKNAWTHLQAVDVTPEFGLSFTYTVPPPDDEWQEDMEVEISGNRAVWICKWGRRPEKHKLAFDQRRKAWLLILPGTPKDELSMKYMCELVENLTKAAKTGLKVVDEEDITIREIKIRMAEEFFQRPRKKVEPKPEEPEAELIPEAEPDLERGLELDAKVREIIEGDGETKSETAPGSETSLNSEAPGPKKARKPTIADPE